MEYSYILVKFFIRRNFMKLMSMASNQVISNAVQIIVTYTKAK